MDNSRKLPTVRAFCAGYGGIERGLDLAGVEHRVVAYVEIEAFAIASLVAKMEAGELAPAPIWTDLKTFPAHLFRDRVDLITGGYPCQPFSAAGRRMGTDDPRHLWPYILRHIKTVRPDRCFFENVDGHISMGLREVLSDLEEAGYTQTWGVFSAAEVGAPHQRKRVYIMADASRGCFNRTRGGRPLGWDEPTDGSEVLADPVSARSEAGLSGQERPPQEGDAGKPYNGGGEQCRRTESMPWPAEPSVDRVVDGCADRVDRIRLLGNGVVPQTAAKAWLTLDDELTGTPDCGSPKPHQCGR